MATIAHVTKKIIQEKPFIHESLEKELINIGALAEHIKPSVENELGKVKSSAIAMAIRRYVEKNQKALYKKVKINGKTDLLIKSDLISLSLSKSPTVDKKIAKLFEIVNFEVGDTLNVIYGNYEILVITNDRYEKRFKAILDKEKIKNIKKELSSVSIKIPQECLKIPGFYFAITKALTLENIPIIDIVNTETEATIVLLDKHITKAYDVLKKEISVEYYKKR